MIKNSKMVIAFSLTLVLICLSFPLWNLFKSNRNTGIVSSFRNLYLIDVNEQDIYKNVSIAGSFNVPYDDLDEISKKLDKSFDIVFYCTNYACTESDRAARLMRSLGFEKVFVYPGGIHEWYLLSLKDNKNYPIEGPANLTFLSKPIKKFEKEEIGAISAEDLSKLLISRKF